MMRLATSYFGYNSEGHVIRWTTGVKKQGVIIVNTTNAFDDSAAFAELRAIQHLIFTANIFNRDIILSGEGYSLGVTASEIHKLANRTSAKKHLFKQAAFLLTRLAGIHIEMISPFNKELIANMNEDTAVVIAENDPLFDALDIPAMGKIMITQHALNQYSARLNSGHPTDVTSSLVNRLRHPSIQKQTLPEKVQSHKKRTYGPDFSNECWGHDSSDLHFTIARCNKTHLGHLVTVFQRSAKYLNQ